MRIVDAISPENELSQGWTYLEDDTNMGPPTRSWAVAWEACCGGIASDSTWRVGEFEGPEGHARQPGPRSDNDDESIMTTRTRSSRNALCAPSRATSLLMVLSLLMQPAIAVLLQQWTNCLSDSVTMSDPKVLQWVPLYVGAEFGNDNSSHNLRVTVWGNVTGSYDTSVTLPAWDDPEWSNPNFTDGKIVRNPFPTTAARLTTLHDTVDVLTYEPYSADFDFCQDVLTNASCPLGPVFDTTDMYVSAAHLTVLCKGTSALGKSWSTLRDRRFPLLCFW